MEKNKQQIKGSNNVQIGVNHGDIIHTEKVIRKTEVIHDNNIHISDAQAIQLRTKIDDIVKLRCKIDNTEMSIMYRKVYRELYAYFSISSYKLLPKDRFEEAIKWFDKQKAFKYRPKLRTVDNEEYRKQLYTSIHAKANQLGLNDKLYQIINELFNPKKPISSLTELSDTRLKKVYTKIFSIK